MLSVSLPIFNKKYKAAIQETQLMQEAIELEKQNQYNQLNAEYSRYKAEMESEQELLKLLAFKVKKTQQILDLSYNEFENALISLTDLLVVQQRLLNFQQEQQISITALKTAETQLNYLTYKNID
jgi:outer membrane protein TolC